MIKQKTECKRLKTAKIKRDEIKIPNGLGEPGDAQNEKGERAERKAQSQGKRPWDRQQVSQ